MKLVIIANPASGGGRACKKIERYVRTWPQKDWEVDLQLTYGPGHAGEIVRDLLASPPDLVAVCGGDGTLNEIVSQVPAPPFPLAILPGGTANVLAHELGLPQDPVLALELSFARVIRRVDLGVVRARKVHHFLLMAGIGFDAYVVSKVGARAKRRAGMVAYYLAALRYLMAYSFPEFQLVTETETLTVSSCLVANARSYGGGLVLTPEADMSDGILDVLALRGKPRFGYLRFILSAWRGRPRDYPWVIRLRSRAVKVKGRRGIWAHVDGELIGTLPLEISVVPASFPLVVGK